MRLLAKTEMHRLLLLAVFAVAACSTSQATRLDDRTFRIEGPGVPGGSEGPNQRMATQLCPNGYRVIDQDVHRGGPNEYTSEPGVFTNWTIRCL